MDAVFLVIVLCSLYLVNDVSCIPSSHFIDVPYHRQETKFACNAMEKCFERLFQILILKIPFYVSRW